MIRKNIMYNNIYIIIQSIQQNLLTFTYTPISSAGGNEGSINMGEKESFNLLERDQGDGWTRVRNQKGDQGFVPTTYIECNFN